MRYSKSFFLVSLLLPCLLLFGCSNDSPQPLAPGQQIPQDKREHIARNFLDYVGAYVYADAKEAEWQTVTLSSERDYIASKKNGERITGSYTWDETGSTITLRDANEASIVSFFVGDKYLLLTTRGPSEGHKFLFQK